MSKLITLKTTEELFAKKAELTATIKDTKRSKPERIKAMAELGHVNARLTEAGEIRPTWVKPVAKFAVRIGSKKLLEWLADKVAARLYYDGKLKRTYTLREYFDL